MSFGSQDGRSHPRVRRFGGDLFGSKWGVEISESVEDTVVLSRRTKLKRCVFRCFLKAATEMTERTDSGRLFQRDRYQSEKLYACVGLDPRVRQTNTFL